MHSGRERRSRGCLLAPAELSANVLSSRSASSSLRATESSSKVVSVELEPCRSAFGLDSDAASASASTSSVELAASLSPVFRMQEGARSLPLALPLTHVEPRLANTSLQPGQPEQPEHHRICLSSPVRSRLDEGCLGFELWAPSSAAASLSPSLPRRSGEGGRRRFRRGSLSVPKARLIAFRSREETERVAQTLGTSQSSA
mmetsp:Transcript_28543/g.39747  ORF Transcript_28543/g.39747 Transcript_28543/m.39747 type:complete len:201 (-) Transcript_28543:254-856(-)|eukprot:CAMPEP_0184484792 /NCGR_PEP_ID=MMETSP0113_2-20130426/6470_1 /TAXON_ID=91329 /ORGANISM="Norrisiella sphaerica, Strain BC52" /LENGTH=200 /DNA_ID=CAMNT_0026865939 /DNA_START=1522 /DNA_END=2124 /DNA_ORIENTATION=+